MTKGNAGAAIKGPTVPKGPGDEGTSGFQAEMVSQDGGNGKPRCLVKWKGRFARG